MIDDAADAAIAALHEDIQAEIRLRNWSEGWDACRRARAELWALKDRGLLSSEERIAEALAVAELERAVIVGRQKPRAISAD